MSTINTRCIYALVDPRDNTARYVGMTTFLEYRLRQHLRCVGGNHQKIRWIQELKKANLEPIVQILEDDIPDAQLARDRKAYWIQYYLGTHAPLTNLQKTGQGNGFPAHTEKWTHTAKLLNTQYSVVKVHQTDTNQCQTIMDEEWVPLSEAAFLLKTDGYDVSVSKLSRMANKRQIQTESDPLDQRVKLVEKNQLRRLFGASKRHRREGT